MMRTSKDWYVVLNMLRALKGDIDHEKLEKYWECYQQLISNPQNLLFIRHDPCGTYDLSKWIRLKPIREIV
jgi:hypothetical protein